MAITSMVLVSGYRPSGWLALAREPVWVAGCRSGSDREAAGVLLPELEDTLGVLQQCLPRPMDERLRTGPVQVAQLTLQRSILQLLRNDTELAPIESSLLEVGGEC